MVQNYKMLIQDGRRLPFSILHKTQQLSQGSGQAYVLKLLAVLEPICLLMFTPMVVSNWIPSLYSLRYCYYSTRSVGSKYTEINFGRGFYMRDLLLSIYFSQDQDQLRHLTKMRLETVSRPSSGPRLPTMSSFTVFFTFSSVRVHDLPLPWLRSVRILNILVFHKVM